MSDVDPSLAAFRDLETSVCDLERIVQIAMDLNVAVINVVNADEHRELELAFAMLQIVDKATKQFKADYFAAYQAGRGDSCSTAV